MLVKKLLICSSPPNGDNKTLLSAVFIFFFPSPCVVSTFRINANEDLKKKKSQHHHISNRRTDGKGWVGAGGSGRRGGQTLMVCLCFFCFFFPLC